MAARVVDWGLAALVAVLLATGVLTLFAGSPRDAWVFAVHDVVGIGIVLLLARKLGRVWPRLRRVAAWERRTLLSIFTLACTAGALATGILWSAGVGSALAGYSVLSWHEALGALLVMAVVAHITMRAKPLRRRDLAGRRQFLTAAAIAAGSLVAWRAQRPAEALLALRGAKRRFTGSYDAGSFTGNAFPATSWIADHPRPLDQAAYRLRVHGLLEHELELALGELPAVDELVATLDCTGGFYSTQRWRGVRVGRLVELAGAGSDVRHVSVISRTGYRWSFAIDDAKPLLLATHVGEEPLSHDHGAPLRLVVPGARGYQWVKWVERLELRATPDYGAPASTLWSSLA